MPLHVNPAEFLLELVNIDFASHIESASQNLDEMQVAWTTSQRASDLSAAVAAVEVKEEGSGSRDDVSIDFESAEKKPSLPSLVLTLCHRSFIKSYRDVVVYGIRFAMYTGE